MSDDYRKMAADAKAALKEREVQLKSETQIARDKRKEYVEKAASPLRDGVLPALQKAVEGFKAEGIDAKIESELDVTSYASRDPVVKFQCLGPRRVSDGWQFEARPIFFSSDGDRMKLGVGNYGFSRDSDNTIAEENVNNYNELVRIGLGKALEFYREGYEQNQNALGR